MQRASLLELLPCNSAFSLGSPQVLSRVAASRCPVICSVQRRTCLWVAGCLQSSRAAGRAAHGSRSPAEACGEERGARCSVEALRGASFRGSLVQCWPVLFWLSCFYSPGSCGWQLLRSVYTTLQCTTQPSNSGGRYFTCRQTAQRCLHIRTRKGTHSSLGKCCGICGSSMAYLRSKFRAEYVF